MLTFMSSSLVGQQLVMVQVSFPIGGARRREGLLSAIDAETLSARAGSGSVRPEAMALDLLFHGLGKVEIPRVRRPHVGPLLTARQQSQRVVGRKETVARNRRAAL